MYLCSTGTYLGCLPLVIIKFMEGAFHKIPDPDVKEFHLVPRACLFLVPGLNKVTYLSLEMKVMKVHHARLLQHCGQPPSCDTAVGVWYVVTCCILCSHIMWHCCFSLGCGLIGAVAALCVATVMWHCCCSLGCGSPSAVTISGGCICHLQQSHLARCKPFWTILLISFHLEGNSSCFWNLGLHCAA